MPRERQCCKERAHGSIGRWALLSPETALWFAVQVVPQHEHKVATQLICKGHEGFLPTVLVKKQWSDRRKVSDRPLFPGYVFCRVQRSTFSSVLSTPGVHRIVSFGGRAHSIPDDEINSLKQVTVSGRDICQIPYVSLGQRVQVMAGPLSGVTGIVTQLKNQNRLIISVDLLLRSIAVDVATSELAPCDS